MYKIIILPLAKKDIKISADWYNKRQKDLGKRFTTEIRKSVTFLKQNPNAFSIRYKNIRTAVVSVFPFMIHYRVDEKTKTLVIAAVLHTSRNPGFWIEK